MAIIESTDPNDLTSGHAEATGWRRAAWSFRSQQFRWLLGSNMAFFFAMNGQFVVRSILAYDLTHSPVALGLINLAVSVPMLAISPFGGVIVDRLEKRRLILAGQSVIVASESTVWVLLLTGHLQFWHMLAAVFVSGSAFPFVMPARQAIIASIVGRQGLANAMALQTGGMNMTRVVAPVTAGLIAALVGVKPMYGISIVLFTAAMLAMSRISRAPAAPRERRTSIFEDLRAGLAFVTGQRHIRILLALSLVPIMLALPFQTLLVVFAKAVWDTGNVGLGLLQACAGIGGIIGSVFVAWQGETPRRLRLMMSALFAFGGTLFLFALSPWFALALPLVLLSDVWASTFNTMNFTAIQILVPDSMRGRVMSLLMMTFGLTPLGTMPVSAAAEAWGAPAAVAGASVLTVLSGIAFLLISRSLREIDTAIADSLHPTRIEQPRA